LNHSLYAPHKEREEKTMKARLFSILAVLALVTVSFAQKNPPNLGVLIMPDSASVQMGECVHIDLFIANNGPRSVTIREVELYCGTSDHSEWYEPLSIKRVTIGGGEGMTVDLDYYPTCAGDWTINCILRFGGSGKGDLIAQPKDFTVTP